MNLVALTGNIATDIELREAGQSVVTSINLAVRDNFKKDTTYFLRVEAWGKTAELLNQYCQKGSKIGVEGSLKVDKFQDKEGNNREVVKVNANRIEFLNTKSDSQKQTSTQNYGPTPGGESRGRATQQNKAVEENPFSNADGQVSVQDDDLPF